MELHMHIYWNSLLISRQTARKTLGNTNDELYTKSHTIQDGQYGPFLLLNPFTLLNKGECQVHPRAGHDGQAARIRIAPLFL